MKDNCHTPGCQGKITVPDKFLYCKKCRRAYNIAKGKPQTPKKRKDNKGKNKSPGKKNKTPKPQNISVPAIIAGEMRSATGFQRSSPMQSNLSRVASTGHVRALTAKKALPRLLLSALSPKASQGQKGFRFNIDQSVTPKKSFTYESTFTVKTTNQGDDFKVMWFASPIIVAQIFSKFPLEISGARYIADQPRQGGDYEYFIMGNKIGFIGELDPDFTFIPAKDFKQYRCLLATGTMMWVGKEIDKNGTYWAARITDREELSSFSPLSKVDNVNTGVDGMISVTAQHVNPIFDWDYIDENDDEIEINKPGATMLEVINIIFSNEATNGAFSYDGLGVPLTATATSLIASFNTITALSSFAIDTAKFSQDLTNKYGAAFFSLNATTGFLKFSDTLEVICTIRKIITQPNAAGISYVPQTISTTFDANAANYANLNLVLLTALRNAITAISTNNTYPTSAGISALDVLFRVIFKSTDLIDPRNANNTNKVRTQIIPDIIEGVDQIAHMADEFLLPVVQVQCDQGRFQISQTTMWELTVEDTSPFTMDTVATNNMDTDMTISKNEMSRFLKVLNAMPPMLEFSGNQLSSYAASELNSRGIFSDVASILGPIASTVFPGASPLIGGLQSIIQGMNL